LALMIFFAFAMQCTSTIAVVHRETNSWKWPAFQFLYMLALAWIAAYAVNHLAMAFIR
jgi:ferrous iron transport protein B